MLNLSNRPIKFKLIAMMTITASVGILIMAAAIIVNEVMTKREVIATELTTLADVIGSRSTGSLTFNDPRTALENLYALQANKNIVYAEILDENNTLFAEYYPGFSSSPTKHSDTSILQTLNRFLPNLFSETIQVSKAIILDDQPIGTINITSSLDAFYRNLIHYLGWVGIIASTCFAISLIVSSALHKLISDPVLALNQATKQVSADNNYSIRLAADRCDELGLLMNSFNTMLVQIDSRDQQLENYSNQLQDQVDKRTGELLEANERRIQWLENMAKFLKHELKNATVGVNSSLDLIERRSGKKPIDVYLQRARKSIGFMRVLLDSVSNASSLEATVYKESLYQVNLSSLINSEIDEYRAFYPQYQLINQCEDEIHVLGNEDRIKQLLDKLIGNAFEHCHSNTPILIGLNKKADSARLTVSNEGVRLPEDKARIFDLFVSMRDSEHWKNDSLGLGLYIVKLIAESHGGAVYAEDRKDKNGARFTVVIPLLDSQTLNQTINTPTQNPIN